MPYTVLRKLNHRLCKTVYITIVSVLVVSVYNITSEITARMTESELRAFNADEYKQRGPRVPMHIFSLSNPVKILAWTSWFAKTWPVPTYIVTPSVTPSGSKCVVTNDKSVLASADALIFHLYDLTLALLLDGKLRNTLPSHHRKDQIWILHNLESNNHIYGDMRYLNGHFNATWSFMKDSEVFAPYGSFKVIRKVDKVLQHFDGFSENHKDGGVAMITSCHDPIGRLYTITKMRKIIPIRILGGCGEGCPGDYASCNDEVLHYKFYFSLENDHCRDYVTEKYWRPIHNGQLPVVNWRYSMDDLVIPNSYININDFSSVEEAALYIREVGKNKTLYNNYFKWRNRYEVAGSNAWEDLCEWIHYRNRTYTTYHDMQGWLTTDTCPTVTILGYMTLRIKRWLSFYVFGF